MLYTILDQLKCSVWGSETCGVWARKKEQEGMEIGLSQSNYINSLPFHPPNFPFQQPHTKERPPVSFTWRRQPLSALLSPSPYKPPSPQGGRCSQAFTEAANQGPPGRAW